MDPSVVNKEGLKTGNINLKAAYNELKLKYYTKLVSNVDSNSKEFYDLMRTKSRNKQELPIKMKYCGQNYFGDQRISQIAKHLKSCFSESIIQFSNCPAIFNHQLSAIYEASYVDTHAELWNAFVNEFSTKDVKRSISELDIKSSSGPMLIAVKFIKYNQEKMAPILLNCFNSILATGQVPTSWKSSYLIPIPKKGSMIDIANYRGISMQAAIPKIFDRLLTEKLYSHVNQIIPVSQHGFMRKKSTTTNLLEVTEFLHEHMKDKGQVDIIYFDFAKAFDRVDHGILAHKLAGLGMPKLFFRTIMSFVTNRRYILKIDGKETNEQFTSRSSVPQGSHIGPLLFLLMTRDITACVQAPVKLLSFADDLKFFAKVINDEQRRQLQQCVDKLFSWSQENRMELNKMKTYFVSYTKSGILRNESVYYIQMDRIQKVDDIRDLGVIFDNRLTFKQHLNNIQRKAENKFMMGQRFVKDIRCPRVIIKLTNSYIIPIIDYCSLIWNQGSRLEHLERVIRQATRFALCSAHRPYQRNYIDFDDRRMRLKVMTFEERRKISAILTVLKILRGELNTQLAEKIVAYHNNVRMEARYPAIFQIPRITNHITPLYQAMNYANSFRHLIRDEDSIAAIKKKLKDNFLR